MKNCKKIIALVSAFALCTAVLTGCGQTGDKTADGKINVIVGNAPDKNTDEAAYKSWQDSADAFMELNPDICLEPQPWAFDAQSFIARAEGGNLPTLYTAHFTEGRKIKEFDYSADLTDFFKENGDYEKLNDAMLENITDESGKIKLIPANLYTLGVVMNMKLMREAGLVDENDSPKVPDTFEELAQMAKIITEKTGKAGFVFPTTGNGGGWLFSNIGWAFGGDFEKQAEDGTWTGTLDSDETVNAMQWLKDMKWQMKAMPATTLVSNADTMKMIGTDQAAMAIAHPGQFNQLIANYGMDLNDIAMVKIPAGPAKRVTLMGGSYYAIANNASKEQIGAALEWIRFKGTTTELTDDIRKDIERETKSNFDESKSVIGIKDLSVWNNNSDVEKFKDEMMQKYRNIPENHVESYNDKSGVEYHTEVEVCAQDMYSILDEVIQTVLNEENSDCRALLKEANDKFISNFLSHEK